MDVFVMESLPSSPIDLEEEFTFENGQDDTISVQVLAIFFVFIYEFCSVCVFLFDQFKSCLIVQEFFYYKFGDWKM